MEAENSSILIDKISRLFTKEEKFRIIVQNVEATLPFVEVPSQKTIVKKEIGKLAISREELYNQVVGMVRLNYLYIFLVTLSAIIAAFGFMEDKWSVIIGFMVVAPLIAPNIAVSLSIVLGHKELGKMGFISMGAGIVLTLILSWIIGEIFHPDLSSKALQGSLLFGYSDIIVAFASGVAGVLAFTTGTSFALIGVMVSISLLPPLVAAGLLLSMAEYPLFINALILFFINFISLNLAGVITFWFQGIRPKNWWEAKKAVKYRKIAIAGWFILLVLLIIGIYGKHNGWIY